jgi:Fe-S cluster assembly protein SufB
MTQWRLAAYRHWLTMAAPHWAKLQIAEIDFQAISYYSAICSFAQCGAVIVSQWR